MNEPAKTSKYQRFLRLAARLLLVIVLAPAIRKKRETVFAEPG